MAWLTFCLIVLRLFGARTLRKIVPYVLAGIGNTRHRPPARTTEASDDGRFSDLILPATCWLIITGAITLILLHP